jgi:predicted Zn-dependent peptidase
MIDFNEYILENGLNVIIHEDHTTPMAIVNILYNVGSKDEHPEKTGFAHLFEHLMFGGSVNVPDYDLELQKVGGDNNAFTNSDITNYYITIPAENLETALWLESDRMLGLSFDPKVLEVQQKVVVEEFKQRYLNQPYGDVWLHLRPLAYEVHPYQWPTIGKDMRHIEDATMEDVKAFFYRHYNPQNAVLVIAGNVQSEDAISLVEKWFGPIESQNTDAESIPAEPLQKEPRQMEVKRKVPQDSIYKVFHMPGRKSNDYYAADLLSDVLGRGKSSRLYQQLVKEKKSFNSISAYVLGSFDPGLLVISGKINGHKTIDEAEEQINGIIDELRTNGVDAGELEKVKNQAESSIMLSEVELLNRAMGLAISSSLGNPNLINEEIGILRSITERGIQTAARDILSESNCSTMYYKAEKDG